MCFVEEEHHFWLFEIADFRQVLEQLRQQPQQETGIQARLQNQLVSGEHIDDAAAAHVLTHEVTEVQCGLAKEELATVTFQTQQLTLDRRDAN